MALTLVGVGSYATTQAYAQSSTMPNLVQMIAQKFNLNQNDVQAVFDQAKQQQMANRQTKIDNRLTQAVKDGVITDAQKQLIVNKLQEIQTQRQNTKDQFKNMTPQQRRDAMQRQIQDLQQWAKDNNIDLTKLKGIFGFGMGMGKGKLWMHGPVEKQ